jgi:hypothetical protein
MDSGSTRTRVSSEGERGRTRERTNEENTLDQILVMLIDANMLSSTSSLKYRRLSLQSACTGRMKEMPKKREKRRVSNYETT